MKIRVSIDQKASLLAGHEAPDSEITYDLPIENISDEDRALLIPHYSHDNFTFNWARPRCMMPLSDDTVAAALHKMADDYRTKAREAEDSAQREAARKMEQQKKDLAGEEAAIDAFMADSSARGADTRYVRDPQIYYADQRHSSLSRSQSGLVIPIRYSPRRAEIDREITRRNQADTAAKDEREKAKMDYIHSWLTEHDPAAAQQWSEGLLDRQDALQIIADAELERAGIPDEYDPSTCDDRNCPCDRQDITALPRSVYARWKTLQAKLPKGSSWSFERILEHPAEDDLEEAPMHYAVQLRVPVGPFSFQRLVRID